MQLDSVTKGVNVNARLPVADGGNGGTAPVAGATEASRYLETSPFEAQVAHLTGREGGVAIAKGPKPTATKQPVKRVRVDNRQGENFRERPCDYYMCIEGSHDPCCDPTCRTVYDPCTGRSEIVCDNDLPPKEGPVIIYPKGDQQLKREGSQDGDHSKPFRSKR